MFFVTHSVVLTDFFLLLFIFVCLFIVYLYVLPSVCSGQGTTCRNLVLSYHHVALGIELRSSDLVASD